MHDVMIKHWLVRWLVRLACAVALVLGLASAKAQMVINPGGLSALGAASGTGAAFVGWDGTTVTWAAVAGADYGYVVKDADNTVATAAGFDLSPIHIGTTTALASDGVSDGPVLYYVAGSNDVLGAGDTLASSVYTSERFELAQAPIPEPGGFALMGGLGLIAFAGYRRWRARA